MSRPTAIEHESDVRTTWDFLALATLRARAHDPTFPDLGELPKTLEEGFCYATWHCAWREGDRGANVSLTGADIGPAEVIHSDQWSAACWGAAWSFRLRFEGGTGQAPRCWQEPYTRPSAEGSSSGEPR